MQTGNFLNSHEETAISAIVRYMEKNQGFEQHTESDLSAFRDLMDRLGLKIETRGDVSNLSEPVSIGAFRAINSLAVHPMEGADGDWMGRPGKLTLRRYERFAKGGAGLIWAEAISVVPEGRANPSQLWIHTGSRDAFIELVWMIRRFAVDRFGAEHRPLVIAQLTHSGRYSRPDGKAAPMIPQRDPYRDRLTPQANPLEDAPSRLPAEYPVLSDEYLDDLQEKYVTAAILARDAGFDGVDIKACHGYLISELLNSRDRKGKYGGSYENRTRFVLEVVEKVYQAVGQDMEVALRLGCYDAVPYPYGWGVNETDYRRADLTEPLKLIGQLHDRGVHLINFTIANPYMNPHYGRPFNQPVKGGYAEPEHPLAGVKRLIDLCGVVQQTYPKMAVVGTGYSWLREMMGPVGAGVIAAGKATLIGGGRIAMAYPDFAADLLHKGKLDPKKVCVGCSGCSQLLKEGRPTGCVIRDSGIYRLISE